MPSKQQQRRIIKRAAQRHNINPAILWGLYGAETNFGQNTNNSSAGAQGPFQFMPGTAASYGIDPHNFRQAADAAAEYLSTYKDRGLAGMLAAYNAGPAGNPNNPETQAYIPKVRELAGTWKNPGGSADRNPANGDQRSAPTYETVPGVDNTALRQGAMQSYLQDRDKPGALLSLKTDLDAAQDVPEQRVRVPGQPVSRNQPGSPANGVTSRNGVGGDLKELFWNGPGALNVKDGQRVPKGFVSGHTDHVHVAGGRKSVDRLGRLAQQMGLHVGENETFDKVDPVHTEGSYHYRDMAIDVSGDAKKMRKFAKRVARLYGV